MWLSGHIAPGHQGGSWWRRPVRFAAVTILAGLSLLTPPVHTAALADVPSCAFGAYLTDLYDLDPKTNTFAARVWIWTRCPDAELDPLPRVSFPNGLSPAKGEPDPVFKAGEYWDLVSLQGAFRHHWDVRNFPFDRHSLHILITAPQDIDHFRFAADRANSSFNRDIDVPGWRIAGFHIDTVEQRYTTNFGDPTVPAGAGSSYSRIRMRIDLVRADPIIFLEMAGPLYIVFVVTVLTFLLTTATADIFQGRIGALGAALFAVILNMQTTGSEIRSTSGMTLLGQLHILTLGYVLFAMIITTVCWRWTVADADAARVMRLNARGILIGTLVYVLATAGLFAIAMKAG